MFKLSSAQKMLFWYAMLKAACNKYLKPSTLCGLPILSGTKVTERVLHDFITKVKIIGFMELISIDMFKPDPMTLTKVHPKLRSDRRYWPHFKGFIGAMDGTHVPAKVSGRDQQRYWNRKNKCSMNILGKYYFVDSGYGLRCGYLGPYRQSRYHPSHFQNQAPPYNYKEKFNRLHFSLRSVIERIFGV
ncbi:F15O4.9 [Arabidopsis thaliana]|uniref:F15O4.9 n=1 Tax=Arabidopsis thaliana TaxID=3702 RepID=Q9LQH6_ARATH|nr:F15O4.9 [Arabidopsis thaliana]